MEALQREGYQTITEDELLHYFQDDAPLPEASLLITFDDGYLSNYTMAYPILKKRGMKATIYPIVSRISEDDPYSFAGEIPKITWPQMREMQDSGLITFQSHTYDSHFKSQSLDGEQRGMVSGRMLIGNKLETQTEYEQRVLQDVEKSKKILEDKLGEEVVAFTYPYGSYSADTIRLLKEAGYQMALNSKYGINTDQNHSLFELKRITAKGSFTADELLKKIKN
nr:polysaccharide deacetylase family protein [Thalassobacillus sp. CUG 92003]